MNKTFAARVLEPMLTHPFPGNVRQLQNAVERSFFMTKGRIITSITIEDAINPSVTDEVQTWFTALSEGRIDFWSSIHDRYKRRDISRDKVTALVDLGLRTTRGSYKNLAALFRVGQKDYRRMMDFLRRNDCLLDFRPYRKLAAL